MSSLPVFTHTLERSGSRLMIRSICASCGNSKLVSKYDGSLQQWEDSHSCAVTEQTKKDPASVAARRQPRLTKIDGRMRRGDPRKIS